MYSSFYSVDGGSKQLWRIYDVNFDIKETVLDVNELDALSPGQVLDTARFLRRPAGTRAGLIGLRGYQNWCMVVDSPTNMLINLDPGVGYPTYAEDRYDTGYVPCPLMDGSVLSEAPNRSIVTPFHDTMVRPAEFKTDAAASEYVNSGLFLEGICARLCAFALEMALVPFVRPIRSKNFNGCLLLVQKYRSDGFTRCLQTQAAITRWAQPAPPGEEEPLQAAIYVGSANMLRGMCLLSRLGDRGGPVRQSRHSLLKQFLPIDTLLVADAEPNQDMPAVAPGEIWDAIFEAAYILTELNNVNRSRFTHHINYLIHNLPVLDTTFIVENGMVARGRGGATAPNVQDYWWRNADRTYGTCSVHPNGLLAVRMRLEAVFGTTLRSAFANAPWDNVSAAFTGALRDESLGAPNDGTGIGRTVYQISASQAAALCYGWTPAGGPLAALANNLAHFELPAAPLGIAMPAGWFITAADAGARSSIFSGHSTFQLYLMIVAPAMARVPIVPPVGTAAAPGGVIASLDNARGLGRGVNDIWVVVTQSQAYPANVGSAVVMEYVPISRNNVRVGGYISLQRLRRFDVNPQLNLLPGPDGVPRNWGDRAAGARRFVNDNLEDPGLIEADPLQNRAFWAGAGNPNERTLINLVWLSRVAFAAVERTMRDRALQRWTAINRRAQRVTSFPREMYLWLGGLREVHSLTTAGGLWTMGLLTRSSTASLVGRELGDFAFLKNAPLLASGLLRLRTGVEVADTLIRATDSRIACAWEGRYFRENTLRRLNSLPAMPYVRIKGDVYSALSTAVLLRTRNSVHASIMRVAKGRVSGGLHCAEPHVLLPLNLRRALSWVRPQVLDVTAQVRYLGTAPNNFYPNEQFMRELTSYEHNMSWRVRGSATTTKMPSALDSLDSEVWSYFFTMSAGRAWRPYVVSICCLDNRVNVTMPHMFQCIMRDKDLPIHRLNVPVEYRMVRVVASWDSPLVRPPRAVKDLFRFAIDYADTVKRMPDVNRARDNRTDFIANVLGAPFETWDLGDILVNGARVMYTQAQILLNASPVDYRIDSQLGEAYAPAPPMEGLGVISAAGAFLLQIAGSKKKVVENQQDVKDVSLVTAPVNQVPNIPTINPQEATAPQSQDISALIGLLRTLGTDQINTLLAAAGHPVHNSRSDTNPGPVSADGADEKDEQ